MATIEGVTGSDDPQVLKEEWLNRLETLVGEVKTWAEASGWRTRRIVKTVEERPLGTYQVPVLLMEKEIVQVVLNPVARDVPRAGGAVDLYLSPAYDDIATLYFEDDLWVVYYFPPPNPAGPNLNSETRPMSFSEATIREILDGMVAHA